MEDRHKSRVTRTKDTEVPVVETVCTSHWIGRLVNGSSSRTSATSRSERSPRRDVASERRMGRSKSSSSSVKNHRDHEAALKEKVKSSHLQVVVKTPEDLIKNVEDLKNLLKEVQAFLNEKERFPKRSSSSEKVEQTQAQTLSIQEPRSRPLIEQSADLVGDFLAKAGDGFKKTGDFVVRIGNPQNEVVKQAAKTFAHMGQLQWAGLALSGIAFALRNWEMYTTNADLLIKTWKSMCRLGKVVVIASRKIPDDSSMKELHIDTIQCAVECIFNCLQESISSISKNRAKRFIFANLTKELLMKHEKEINNKHIELQQSAVLQILESDRNQKLTTGNTNPCAEKLDIVLASDDHERRGLVGIEDPLQKVKEMLQISGGEKQETQGRAVVIHGMGGIGKSTLGQALYYLISGKEIDEGMACMLDMTPPNTVDMLQDELLLKFGCRERRPASRNVMKQKLVQCFKSLRRCVFIFIDNVENGSLLEELLPYPVIPSLEAGVRILIATRNGDVRNSVQAIGIPSHQIELFEMRELDKDLSKTLLRYHMLKDLTLELPVTLLQYEERVLKSCEGLPLALEVIGSYLHGKASDEDQWRWVIKALEKPFAPDGSADKDYSLISALEFSYSNINSECQQAFIDIGFCFNHSPWSDLEILYGPALEILRTRALLKKEVKLFKDTGLQVECVKVHPCFVTLCRKKAEDSGSHKCIDGSSATWKFEKVPQVLVLQGGCSGGYQTVPAAHLDNKLERLRILIMTDVKFEGNCNQVPGGLTCLYCHHSNVPFTMVDLKHLKLVDISSAIDTVYKMPRGVRRLRLDAPSLKMLQFAPDSEMQELGLMFCPSLELKEEKNTFPSLKKLVIRNADQIELLPTQLTSLQSLSVQSCKNLRLAKDLNFLRNLEHLHISGANLRELPEALSRMTQLTSVALESCSQLANLPKEMGISSQFEFLEVKDCSNLKTIPDSIQAWVQDKGDHWAGTGVQGMDNRREQSSKSSRWLISPRRTEELQQKVTAAKSMLSLIHSRGTFDRLSDLLYELHSEEVPDVEIVFFPGIHRDAISNREAHWRTWKTKGREECWPQTLLPEELEARNIKPRVLSLSYESLLNNSTEPEDLLAGTIIRDLILHPDSCVGQKPNVPVILVGHGLGGIVIKHFTRTVLRRLRANQGGRENEETVVKLGKFCNNLKAFVFYGTPLGGSPAMEKLSASIEEGTPNKMDRFLKVLSNEMAILNEYIAQERTQGDFNVQIFALCEMNDTNQGDFENVVVVPEASARQDTDEFRTFMEDHYGVAQVEDQTSTALHYLAQKVEDVVGFM
ncbi:hypothetical protein Mapa_002411 [Marchantia paleacea]|nr:hypothetical protein Mapa_002411 [Marchantia paleacea]